MTPPDFTPEIVDRFWSRVDRSGGPDACWPWTGYTHNTGYGRMGVKYDEFLSHRLAWELTNGPIPTGLWVLHRCDNPPCCNPAHLWLGTNADNTADRVAKGRGARGGPGVYRYGDEHWTHLRPDQTLRGERNPIARLSEEDVRDIRHRHASGNTTLAQLGREYGTTRQAIWQIVSRRNWRHVE